ncbi:MAG: hypothetical protein ACOCXA_00805 [Planctomycetota bacterium]
MYLRIVTILVLLIHLLPAATPPPPPGIEIDSGTNISDELSSPVSDATTHGAADDAEGSGHLEETSDGEILSELDGLRDAVNAVPGSDPESLLNSYLAHSADYQSELRKSSNEDNVDLSGNRRPIFGRFSIETVRNEAPLNRADYMRSPSRVSFVKSGKNMLQGVQDKLDKAKNTLEKIFPCSSFDWVTNFSTLFNLEALQNYAQGLMSETAAAMPMALLQAISPNLAEIMKHLKVITSFDLSANKMDCNDLQQVLTPAFGGLLRGPGYSNCMAGYKDADIGVANRQCAGDHPVETGLNIGDGIRNITANVSDTVSNLNNNAVVEPFAPFDLVATAVDKFSGTYMSAAEENAQIDNTINAGAQMQHSDPANGDADADSANKQRTQEKHQTGKWFEGRTAGVANFFKETLGSITFSAESGLQLGNAGGRTYRLRLQAKVVELSQNLELQLLNYGQWIDSKLREDWRTLLTGPSVSNADQMRQARESVAMHCMYTMQNPWLHLRFEDQEEVEFTNSTIDKLAHIMYRVSQDTYVDADDGGTKVGPDGLPLIMIYHPADTLKTIVTYELSRFRYEELWTKHIDEITEKVNGIMDDTNKQKDYDASALTRWEIMKDRKAKELQADYVNLPSKIRNRIKTINGYDFPIPDSDPADANQGTSEDRERNYADTPDQGFAN